MSEIEEEIPEKYNDFSKLLNELIMRIVDDAMVELQILENLCKFPKLNDFTYQYKTLEEKYGKKNKRYKLPGVLNNESSKYENYEVQKLEKLMNLCGQILQDVKNNLTNKTACEELNAILSNIEKEEREEQELLDNTKEMVKKVTQLENEIEVQQLQGFLTIKEKDEYIGRLKDKYENSLCENSIKETYLHKWEEAKVHQVQLDLERKEYKQKDKIRDLKNKNAREARIHKEIEAYTKTAIDDYYDSINYWTKKYETDMSTLNKELQKLKMLRIKQRVKFATLTALRKARETEMENYKVLKEQRRQEAAERDRLDKEATKIQAWWRGEMVRHKLGPYKVKKGKGKGKNKGGAQNNKKKTA